MLVLWMGLWLRPLVWWRGCFSLLLRCYGGDRRAVRAWRECPGAEAPGLSDDAAVAKMGHPISWLGDVGRLDDGRVAG
jgi:hypothetical protein